MVAADDRRQRSLKRRWRGSASNGASVRWKTDRPARKLADQICVKRRHLGLDSACKLHEITNHVRIRWPAFWPASPTVAQTASTAATQQPQLSPAYLEQIFTQPPRLAPPVRFSLRTRRQTWQRRKPQEKSASNPVSDAAFRWTMPPSCSASPAGRSTTASARAGSRRFGRWAARSACSSTRCRRTAARLRTCRTHITAT